MDVKKSIKEELQNYFKSRISYSTTEKSRNFDFSKIRKIAFLFLIHGKEELNRAREVLKAAKKDGFEAIMLAYSDTGKTPDIITDRNVFVFTRDDFNYKWKPMGDLKEFLEKMHFDLLINFCMDGRPEIVNLFTLINTDFRIANQNPNHFDYNDLTIKIDDKHYDWLLFYNLAVRNLEMLNIKK
ncbi:MAG: hypothetical protein GXO88_00945 [Chlorobi bacterium]|nr:hypothetical protein [Chlorobiota bacterium]